MIMKREDYKKVKHMNRPAMTAYVQTIYQRGYEAGVKSTKNSLAPMASPEAEVPESAPASE